MPKAMIGAVLATVAEVERARLAIHGDCRCHCRRPRWIAICEEDGVARSISHTVLLTGQFEDEGLPCNDGDGDVLDWSVVTSEELAPRMGVYIEHHNTERIKRSFVVLDGSQTSFGAAIPTRLAAKRVSVQ